MKKKLLAVLIAVLLVASALTIAACVDPAVKHKVTFYDGKNVIKEVDVEDGKTVESFVPTKEGGYQFIDWFSTPSYGHKFDFSKTITEDTSVFAGFTLFKDDTRTYYVVGSGTSELLIGQNWGKNINESHRLTKTEGKNEYKITMDLLEGDEFQFAISSAWENKRGYGYLTTDKLPDGTVAFSGEGGGLGEVTAKGRNIKVAKSGNYTLTLKTYPNEDTYNTSDPTYTEAGKEVYNVGTFDTIDFVRNGDPLVAKVVVTNFFIKGQDITGWANMYNAATTMSKNGDVYTLSTYMKAGDQFMFASYNSSADGVSAGSLDIKSNALDTASRSVVDGYTEAGGNMTTKKAGVHTFVYNKATDVLTVTVDDTKGMTVYDYYLDGKTKSGISWKEADLTSHKLTETAENSGIFEIKNVALAVGDEIVIRSFTKGTQQPKYADKLTDYDSTYLLAKLEPTANFTAISATNNNIKVLKEGAYDISFNAYTKRITVIEHSDDTLDIYIKGDNVGDQTGWKHNFDAKYRFTLSADKKTYEYVLTVAEGKPVNCGLEKHPKGETTGYGEFLAAGALGTDGDANALFTPASGTNLTCSTAGTYKFVYNIASGKLDIYAVTQA